MVDEVAVFECCVGVHWIASDSH